MESQLRALTQAIRVPYPAAQLPIWRGEFQRRFRAFGTEQGLKTDLQIAQALGFTGGELHSLLNGIDSGESLTPWARYLADQLGEQILVKLVDGQRVRDRQFWEDQLLNNERARVQATTRVKLLKQEWLEAVSTANRYVALVEQARGELELLESEAQS